MDFISYNGKLWEVQILDKIDILKNDWSVYHVELIDDGGRSIFGCIQGDGQNWAEETFEEI